jgi:diguanylate cyclase (GGDEF)-like protein
VSIAGKTIGVLHATAPDREPPDRDTAADIELIARKVGERLGLLRAFSRSESQAHTDPLTGLCNRRSLETQVRDVVHEELPYVVAYGDLDHFKDLNDVYGHDAGDRALRLFARVLRDNLRPNDIPARYGGEEFVVVFPNCPVGEAEKVVERIRERLGAALYGGTVPPFTASFGLAASDPVLTFGETLEAADASLLQAKIRGRDRIVVAGADTVQPAPAMTETLSPATP